MRTKIHTIVALLISLILFSCNKNDKKRCGTLKIQVNHQVDGKELAWDTLEYRNQAGNIYSVERLQYYISDLRFYGNQELVKYIDTAIYIDARILGRSQMVFQDFPFRYVDSVTFLIGVTPKYNIAGGLPATMENAVMDWPEMMGGGYHFLKLEGRWLDKTQTPGFAMHIGKPGYQVNAGLRCVYLLREDRSDPLIMTMNINEWFRNPHQYDFSTDGVYSMGNDVLMQKLKDNGADVFALK